MKTVALLLALALPAFADDVRVNVTVTPKAPAYVLPAACPNGACGVALVPANGPLLVRVPVTVCPGAVVVPGTYAAAPVRVRVVRDGPIRRAFRGFWGCP